MNEFAKPNLAVSQIPSSSVADAGKALVVGEDGVPIWGSGGGGSGGGSGGGGVLVCHLDFQTLAIDHTWQEIYDAGFSVLLVPSAPIAGAPYTVALMGYIIGAEAENEYGVNFYAASAAQGGGYELVKYDVYTDSPNGYPVLHVG
jgi:hypothetical protein